MHVCNHKKKQAGMEVCVCVCIRQDCESQIQQQVMITGDNHVCTYVQFWCNFDEELFSATCIPGK